jgi:undecaprenyl-diphosphatase
VIAGIDETILDWVVEHRTPWLTRTAQVITRFGTTPVTIVAVLLLGGWRSYRERRWIPLAVYVAAELTIEVLARVMKVIIGRSRPPSDLAIEHLANASMPASHVARAALVATLLWFALPRRARLAGLLGGAVAVSAVAFTRFYLASHWFTDTLVAWPIGIAAGIAADRLARTRPARSQTASSAAGSATSSSSAPGDDASNS